MDGQGTAEGCPQGGSRLPPASPVPPSPDPGAGGFVIELGGVCYQDTYPDVSYVYLECILESFEIRVKYMQNVNGYMYSLGI